MKRIIGLIMSLFMVTSFALAFFTDNAAKVITAGETEGVTLNINPLSNTRSGLGESELNTHGAALSVLSIDDSRPGVVAVSAAAENTNMEGNVLETILIIAAYNGDKLECVWVENKTFSESEYYEFSNDFNTTDVTEIKVFCWNALTFAPLAAIGTYIPMEPMEKTTLFIGQDLTSVAGYVDSKMFPMPYGTTTYLNFYGLCSPLISNYGGLCMDNNMKPTTKDTDWGAGPLNAYKNLTKYPDCAVSIGLYMVEDKQNNRTLAKIIDGSFDKEIDKLASYINLAKRPVFLRIGYEFDGIWNNYSPDPYKKAFRYIVERIRNQNVNGSAGEYLVAVWQACASPSNDKSRGSHVPIANWYPGDDVVDWVGFSYFVPGWKATGSALTQEQLADEVVNFARQHEKNVMIAEATPQGYDLVNYTRKAVGWIDGTAGTLISNYTKDEAGAKKIWDEWFASYFSYIDKNRDVIKAVSYINANWNSQSMWKAPYDGGYWGDTRIEKNNWILNKWKEEITSDKWEVRK